MALGKQVEDSLKEAESNLRNALSFAARGERPFVCKQIAEMISNIDQIGSFDGIMDTLENYTNEKDIPED